MKTSSRTPGLVPVTDTDAVTPVLPVTVAPAAGAVMQTAAEYTLLDGLLVEHDPAATAWQGRPCHAACDQARGDEGGARSPQDGEAGRNTCIRCSHRLLTRVATLPPSSRRKTQRITS